MQKRKAEQPEMPKETIDLLENATMMVVEKARDARMTNMTTFLTDLEAVAKAVSEVQVEAKGVVTVLVLTKTTHVPHYSAKVVANAVDSTHLGTQLTRRTPTTTRP